MQPRCICIVSGSFWASKLGAKNVLIFSVLLWSIATFITPFVASSVAALVVCRIVLGFAEGLGNIIVVKSFQSNLIVLFLYRSADNLSSVRP